MADVADSKDQLLAGCDFVRMSTWLLKDRDETF